MRQEDDYCRGRHVVSALNVHLVFVTKYRHGVQTGEHLDALRDVFASVCTDVGATWSRWTAKTTTSTCSWPTRRRSPSPGW
jgi:REP element-mobilizing transposase RayT